jgi:hypothetical protein
MSIDAIGVLRRHQADARLGAIAAQALQFIDGSPYKVLHTPGSGESSLSIVRMWEIRRSLKGFNHSAFVGLEESLACLRERDVAVHLAVIETERGLVSLWVVDEANPPLAIIIAKFAT